MAVQGERPSNGVRDARSSRAERQPCPGGGFVSARARLSQSAEGGSSWVSGLVKAEFAAAGQLDRCQQSEALVADRTAELDSLALEFVDGRVGVVAHEVELVMAGLVGWVGGQFGGWEGENEPALPRVDRRELEHVSEEGANAVGVVGENDRVDPGDHAFGSPATGRVGEPAIQESSSDWVR